MTKLADDYVDLHRFAFELRKADVDDKYTRLLFDGAVKPPILVSIICSNQWVAAVGKMKVDSKI